MRVGSSPARPGPTPVSLCEEWGTAVSVVSLSGAALDQDFLLLGTADGEDWRALDSIPVSTNRAGAAIPLDRDDTGALAVGFRYRPGGKGAYYGGVARDTDPREPFRPHRRAARRSPVAHPGRCPLRAWCRVYRGAAISHAGLQHPDRRVEEWGRLTDREPETQPAPIAACPSPTSDAHRAAAVIRLSGVTTSSTIQLAKSLTFVSSAHSRGMRAYGDRSPAY